MDETYPDRQLTPLDNQTKADCVDLEQQLDQNIGENIRRLYYFYLLPYPELIRYFFMHRSPTYKRAAFTLLYPLLRNRIRAHYTVNFKSAQEAKLKLRIAIHELNQRLKNNRFLLGSTFSRADITAASMLSFLVIPPEHPVKWPSSLKKLEIWKIRESFLKEPAIEWAGEIYKKFR